MLMLTRRIGESITLQLPSGQQIHIAVGNVRGNVARIGIDAPDNVIIARNELLRPAKVNARGRR